MKEGGNVSTSTGNDYLKVQGSYYWINENGFSASVLSSTTGNGYVDGTKFEQKIFYCFWLKNKWNMIFNYFTMPQWHHQRSFANPLSDYLKYGSNGEPNIKYNLVGDIKWRRLIQRNFYHKPVASIIGILN
jgi:hypothetical protein